MIIKGDLSEGRLFFRLDSSNETFLPEFNRKIHEISYGTHLNLSIFVVIIIKIILYEIFALFFMFRTCGNRVVMF